MEFVFIDETGDHKFKDYFGLCAAVINSAHYKKAKFGLQEVLKQSKWDETIEFKGSHIFSTKRGDPKVSIEERVIITRGILDLNVSNENARMRFHYASKQGVKDTKDTYLNLLPRLLEKALGKAKKGQGKDLICISCDERDDISAQEIERAIGPVLETTGYTLFERVQIAQSGFETVGILYADIVAYLSARVETISTDLELFDGLTSETIETNGKVRKLKSSTDLITRIKKLDRHIIDESKPLKAKNSKKVVKRSSRKAKVKSIAIPEWAIGMVEPVAAGE